MRAVYIAGPYRAKTAWEIERNVRAAEEWILPLAELGVLPVVPHAAFRWFHGTMPDEFWLRATLELMRRCDAVFLIPGWHRSLGTHGEREEAAARRIPVFERLEDLAKWAKLPPSPSGSVGLAVAAREAMDALFDLVGVERWKKRTESPNWAHAAEVAKRLRWALDSLDGRASSDGGGAKA